MTKKDLQIKQLQEQAEFQSRMLVRANQKISDLTGELEVAHSVIDRYQGKLREINVILRSGNYGDIDNV